MPALNYLGAFVPGNAYAQGDVVLSGSAGSGTKGLWMCFVNQPAGANAPYQNYNWRQINSQGPQVPGGRLRIGPNSLGTDEPWINGTDPHVVYLSYAHENASVWDGALWRRVHAEGAIINFALQPGIVFNSMYDIFLWANAIPQIANEFTPRSRRATSRKVPSKALMAILSETASLGSGESSGTIWV